jgi:hypothetical protein
MMKLIYWVAENLKDDKADSIVARTKHDCEQKVILVLIHHHLHQLLSLAANTSESAGVPRLD